jgi:hypothetical protein
MFRIPFWNLEGYSFEKVSVFYKPIIKLGRFDWTEYNIVKGSMKVWQHIDNCNKIPIFQFSLNTNVHRNDEIVNIYIVILQMDSKQLKVANQKFSWHKLFLYLML